MNDFHPVFLVHLHMKMFINNIYSLIYDIKKIFIS